jgi:hypothetical protein
VGRRRSYNKKQSGGWRRWKCAAEELRPHSVMGQYACPGPELLVNIAHTGKVDEGELGHSRILTDGTN